MCFLKISYAAEESPQNASFSLLLSEKEQDVVSNVLLKTKDKKQKNEDMLDVTCFYCNGILYMNGQKWTLWLNDQMYNHESLIPGLTILSANQEGVEIKIENGDQKSIWLKTDQTYCVGSTQVMNGDQR